ncbi:MULTISPECIES: DUF2971 domain-containing protein [unclassified Rhizobium]|uniref:DUF2971 domain-containing protein n=1 Tax=unclassified Rhizobium TaxID=2613769 RepID=UPI000CDF33B2|nr:MULTISPECIES: DUF2971 domain-containing protein [Rhizobium]AVA23039.1 hypothetical protein NXC24_CH03417 [Rhizobium sp. NXC24]UWU20402.1 DUF2971 domain-containing protein [Rhizobium tropici]
MNYEKVLVISKNWTNDRLYFYKYMTATTAKIVLRNRTLRWSAPALFNDPFDIQFNMQITADLASVKPLALERLWDVYQGRLEPDPQNPVGRLFKLLRDPRVKLSKDELFREFGPAFEEGFERMLKALPTVNAKAAKLLEDLKILCLTVRPDNSLMWAHYADSHKGVILRFRSIPAFDSPYGAARPIEYVDQVPPLVSEIQLADIFAGVGTLDRAGILDRAVYTKSTEWAYEEEWRLNSGGGRRPGELFEDVPFGRNELDGLIFGLRTSADDRAELTALSSNYPNVELLVASRSENAFGLVIRAPEDLG